VRQTRRIGIHIGILAFLSAHAQSHEKAQPSEASADARCVVIGLNIAGMADASRQSAGTMLALYYIGRLEGRVPKLDLEHFILGQMAGMAPSDFESEARRCGLGLSEKGQEITKIGNAIAKHEQRKSEKLGPPVSPTK
jgi:hypothetical protein